MSTSDPKTGERVKDVRVSEDTISVDLRRTNHNGPVGVVPPVITCRARAAGELAHCRSRVRNTLAGP